MDAPQPKRRRLTEPLQYSMVSTDEPYKRFVDAACRGDLETVKRMLKANMVPVDCSDNQRDSTALIAASYAGSLPIVQTLIAAGANVNYRNSRGVTALCAACCSLSNVQVVEELLQAGAHVDVRDKMGRTPLLQLLLVDGCSSHIPKQVEIAKLLLDAGCDVKTADYNGFTPLMQVCEHDNMGEIFDMLINAGAHVNSKDERYWYLLLFIDAAYRGNLTTVKRMLEVDSVFIGCPGALHAASYAGHLSVVQALIKAGANLNQITDGVRGRGEKLLVGHGIRTALQIASLKGHLPIVQALIEAGANVNFITECGTALHDACSICSEVQIVEELLKAGAQVDVKNMSGQTPLLCLLSGFNSVQRQVETTRLLLSAGCDVNAEDNRGYSPLLFACWDNHTDDILHMLIEAGASLTRQSASEFHLLHECVRASAVPKVRMLLDHGIDIKESDGNGHTALHLAVQQYDLNVMLILLQHADAQEHAGAAITTNTASAIPSDQLTIPRIYHPRQRRLIDCQDKIGYKALHYAVMKKSLQLVQELLKWKPNFQTEPDADHYFTPLNMAVCDIADEDTEHEVEIVRCLIEHPNGYGLDQVNKFFLNRGTALHLAIEKQNHNLTVIEYLSNIIDLRLPDINGNTALHLAVKQHQAGKIVPHLLRSRYAKEAVNMRNHNGTTALHDAITHGRDSDTVIAIAGMADVNMTDCDGKTPLHYAVEATTPGYAYANILLYRMADVSIRDHHGNTAFVLACSGNRQNKYQLSTILALYRHGVAYGKLQNMV